jgi:dinuclear metal center YbgI/SA1388 family protein
MNATVADIVRCMEALAPLELAEKWDNVGLQVGSMKWGVETLWIALDATSRLMHQAKKNRVDMIITHHPLIFKPLSSIDFDTPIGSIVLSAVRNKIALYSAHTNLDCVSGGINDILVERLGLINATVLDTKPTSVRPLNNPSLNGIGRIGVLDPGCRFSEFIPIVKQRLNLKWVRFSGPPDLMVRKAAVCSGSGSSMMEKFLTSEADIFISGDLHYHDARSAESAGRGIIDIGHFASEQIFITVLTKQLQEQLQNASLSVRIVGYEEENDPFMVVSTHPIR